VDELVLLNVARGEKHMESFCQDVSKLSSFCFMPIAAGGGIQSLDDAYRLLDSGADKLIVNSALFTRPDLVRELVQVFGRQCIVASLDYKCTALGAEAILENGQRPSGLTLDQAIVLAEDSGAGELYVTSIDQDGTGQGYDLETVSWASRACRVPVIASGGVGDFRHFLEGLQIENVTGVSTANIFNFLGDGLTKARDFIQKNDVQLANWNFDAIT
jgi:cyclase